MTTSRHITAQLEVGDDLSRELNCVVPGGTSEMMAVQQRAGLPP